MTGNSKRELLEAIRPRYRRANKAEKTCILDEFVAITGYHRKHAIRLLKHGVKKPKRKKRGRPKVYTGQVISALIKIWKVCDCICSKRLHPFLPEMMAVLEREEELALSSQAPCFLTGSLWEKQAIPVRTFADWDDARPGFVEMDLVAHCGDSTHGEYLNTLNVVDVFTGWSECPVLANRSQREVSAAIERLRERLPVPLLGIDSDNDSAFINDNLYRYCKQEKITFTRSRPYKKNDQAHVEQKNWSVVRRLIGYERYESDEALTLMRAIYQDWRLYVNFFQPVLKLVEKRRVGSKVRKRYDTARTPYQRVLESPDVSEEDKEHLRQIFLLRQRYPFGDTFF